ncbi:protein windbeutel [Chironomus tepperi]|uniref:protein windbeutel n=1 Tax=Chironomus tepperi TaxID=113505 RepID=UPI00391FA7C2
MIRVIFFVFSLINLTFCCPGCIDLDELTFVKTINKFRTALIKFDVAFPYGPNHEAYSAFSQAINNKTLSGNSHPDVLIGTISVKDYGDFENKKIADKYDIKVESFPVIKLFIDHDLDNPIHFERGQEDITTEKLFLFLKEHSKVYIQAPGCNQKLDEMTDKFMIQKSQRPEILKQVEEVIGKIDCEEEKSLSKFYAVLMKGIIEKGDDFVNKQQERIAKLLKDKLSKKKVEELTKKLNILSSFKHRDNSKDEL